MPTLGTAGVIHLVAAAYVLIGGAVQLARPKGTAGHKAFGRTWLAAMTIVAVSSFWMRNLPPILLGYGPIHLLSLWVLFCVVAAIGFARRGNIRRHRGFAIGAYLGAIGAALGAFLAPGRFLHQWLFGS